jgi:hypothetical protein
MVGAPLWGVSRNQMVVRIAADSQRLRWGNINQDAIRKKQADPAAATCPTASKYASRMLQGVLYNYLCWVLVHLVAFAFLQAGGPSLGWVTLGYRLLAQGVRGNVNYTCTDACTGTGNSILTCRALSVGGVAVVPTRTEDGDTGAFRACCTTAILGTHTVARVGNALRL